MPLRYFNTALFLCHKCFRKLGLGGNFLPGPIAQRRPLPTLYDRSFLNTMAAVSEFHMAAGVFSQGRCRRVGNQSDMPSISLYSRSQIFLLLDLLP